LIRSHRSKQAAQGQDTAAVEGLLVDHFSKLQTEAPPGESSSSAKGPAQQAVQQARSNN
jgi:hypothetical protein